MTDRYRMTTDVQADDQCNLTVDPEDPEDDWHHDRVCEFCEHRWRGLHCQCDGHQNPCPKCGKRPIPKPCPEDE